MRRIHKFNSHFSLDLAHLFVVVDFFFSAASKNAKKKKYVNKMHESLKAVAVSVGTQMMRDA